MDFRYVDLFYRRKGLISTCLTVMFGVAVLMCYFGLQYLEACPIREEIPLYLLIGGSCLLLLTAMLFCSHAKLMGDNEHREEVEMITTENAYSDSSQENFHFSAQAARNVKIFLTVAYILWFFLGNYWVFSVYMPPFSQPLRSPTPQKFCEQPVYVFALLQIAFTHIFFCCLLLTVLCLCCFFWRSDT
ncbi:hypothetical protein M514_11717 [Trichuris suis]|uniref:Transmembrane protein 272 n=1 Tax=Trichuris suis TaxID=68888 RepID=A0A085LR10_9BILA|nr:hypothetical protein M513_11717 [Trichuris suis]KFD63045.1 hypothetical protein M514_11717 [Trichuris suis]